MTQVGARVHIVCSAPRCEYWSPKSRARAMLVSAGCTQQLHGWQHMHGVMLAQHGLFGKTTVMFAADAAVCLHMHVPRQVRIRNGKTCVPSC